MRNLLSRLLAGVTPTGRALRQAHEAAEIARLRGIANEPPPPGIGWRVGDQDSEGKWTVWNGPRKIAAFWDENDAAEWARKQNRDPGRPNPVQREDGKYCVNCGSRETDESLKARGYVSCCPERYVIAETWAVTADRLATGQFHLWRPADGLESITDGGWDERAGAQHEADHRNLLAHRPHAAIRPTTPEMSAMVDAVAPAPGVYSPEQIADPDAYMRRTPPALARPDWTERKAAALAAFIDVPIPDGVRMVVGPHKSPDDGNWWTFDRNGPVRGYTRKANAQAAADRANNGPAS
jgi:hypothetical protein